MEVDGAPAAAGPAPPVHLPEGCSIAEARPFFATMDQWGGDAARRATCKLRAVCSYRANGQHLMVSDHMWLDGADAERIMAIVPSEGRPVVLERFGPGLRPKRGVRRGWQTETVLDGRHAEGHRERLLARWPRDLAELKEHHWQRRVDAARHQQALCAGGGAPPWERTHPQNSCLAGLGRRRVVSASQSRSASLSTDSLFLLSIGGRRPKPTSTIPNRSVWAGTRPSTWHRPSGGRAFTTRCGSSSWGAGRVQPVHELGRRQSRGRHGEGEGAGCRGAQRRRRRRRRRQLGVQHGAALTPIGSCTKQ